MPTFTGRTSADYATAHFAVHDGMPAVRQPRHRTPWLITRPDGTTVRHSDRYLAERDALIVHHVPQDPTGPMLDAAARAYGHTDLDEDSHREALAYALQAAVAAAPTPDPVEEATSLLIEAQADLDPRVARQIAQAIANRLRTAA
ncbi:hypothetical protein [Brachybacterium sp. NPDC056505]|uniref:hypothetical protein n=1 Tax=Brachybacterium sp. NPDC056505 TaxID=3345843 RepID=UPI00366B20CB